MPDTETAALLRSVLDELCAQAPQFDMATRTSVASKLLEATKQDRCSPDDLRAEEGSPAQDSDDVA